MEGAVALPAIAASVAGNLSKPGVISEIKALEAHLDVSAHTTSKLQAAEAAGALGTRWRDTKLESYPLGRTAGRAKRYTHTRNPKALLNVRGTI